MKTQKLDHITERNFPEGEWTHEPDKANWEDKETGLPCMIVRNNRGTLCGYVGVPLDSTLSGKNYDDVDVSIHGGLTYSHQCQGVICHEAEKEVFWFGFDCAHSGDYSPSNALYEKEIDGELFSRKSWEIYRNFNYVKAEVEFLAKQLKALL